MQVDTLLFFNNIRTQFLSVKVFAVDVDKWWKVI